MTGADRAFDNLLRRQDHSMAIAHKRFTCSLQGEKFELRERGDLSWPR